MKFLNNRWSWVHFTIVLALGAVLSACILPWESSDGPVPSAETDMPVSLKKASGPGEFERYMKASLTRLVTINNQNGAFSGLYTLASDRAPLPSVPDAMVADGSSSTTAPVSDTNRIEAGVDESDTVKTDGTYLFVLERAPTIYYFDRPVSTVGVALVQPEPGPIPKPHVIRVLQRGKDEPSVKELAKIELDTALSAVEGFYLIDRNLNSPGSDTLLVVAQGNNFVNDQTKDGFIYSPHTVVVTYDVSDHEHPAKLWEFSIEGYLNTTRSLNNHLYLVTQKYSWPPNLILHSSNQDELTAAKEAINNLDVETLLPKSRLNGEDLVLVTPRDCLIPSDTNSESVYTGNLLTLVSIPLENPQKTTALCSPENSETVYASSNALYVTASQHLFVNDSVSSTYQTNTLVHEFKYSDNGFDYVASGKVRGWLGWQNAAFRLSESQGDLRIVTTNNMWSATREHQLHVLRPSAADPSRLDIIAGLPNEKHPEPIGKPGEDIHAVRFTPKHAYIVTFQRTDPLYAINLAHAEDPYIEGELEIPGFSDYLHPLGEDYLLGVGKDSITENGNAYFQGINVGLFDVRNKNKPDLVGKLSIGKRGSDALVTADYKSFAIINDTQAQQYRVVLPVRVHDDPNAKQDLSPMTWYPWYYNGAHLLEINYGETDSANLKDTGVLVSERAPDVPNYTSPSNTRAIIVGDQLHYIQNGKVWSAEWSNPAATVGPQ